MKVGKLELAARILDSLAEDIQCATSEISDESR